MDGSSNGHSTDHSNTIDDDQQHYDTNEDPSPIVHDRVVTESTLSLVEERSLVPESIGHENEDEKDIERPQVKELSQNNDMQQPMDAPVVPVERSSEHSPTQFNNAIDAYVVQNGTHANNDEKPVFEAIPYQDPTTHFKTYTRIAWAIGVSLVLAIVVSISVVVPTQRNAVNEVADPTTSPTEVPELPNAPVILAPVMNAAFQHDEEAAQIAFDWLLEEDRSGILEDWKTPDWKVIQRYVAAFLFYTLGGPNGWYHRIITASPVPSDDFLNPTSECEWNTIIPFHFSEREALPEDERGNFTLAGIQCNNQGRINRFQLPQLNVTGSIPYQVVGSFLLDLESLDFFDCLSLSNQTLGSEIGMLSNLSVLFLGYANQIGSIPTELGFLTDLATLSLNGNAISGSVPSELGRWTSIANAQFLDNALTGSIPSELGLWTSIESFGATENLLTGSIPSELGRWTSITNAQLYDNTLTGSIPSELGQWTSIESFGVSQNQLIGSIPSELGSWTKITGASFFDNDLTGTIPSELGLWTSIEGFDVSGNNLIGSIPSHFGRWTSITRAQLFDNALTGTIPSELGFMTAIENIAVSRNLLTGSIPSQLGSWTSITKAQFFSNMLTGSIPSELGKWTSIENFDVEINAISGRLPSDMGRWTMLNVGYFNDNFFSGQLPSELGDWTDARRVYFHNTSLTGTVPLSFAGWTNAEEITVPSTLINGTLPLELLDLPIIAL